MLLRSVISAVMNGIRMIDIVVKLVIPERRLKDHRCWRQVAFSHHRKRCPDCRSHYKLCIECRTHKIATLTREEIRSLAGINKVYKRTVLLNGKPIKVINTIQRFGGDEEQTMKFQNI